MDSEAVLIHSVETNAANLHDPTPAADLPHGEETVVYPYREKENRLLEEAVLPPFQHWLRRVEETIQRLLDEQELLQRPALQQL